MPRGGARNRSGPSKDEQSLRSGKAGYTLTALPSEGYKGRAPKFPIPQMRLYRWETEEKHRFQVFDQDLTDDFRGRELELWRWAWRTPQACAWSLEPWRWYIVGMWVRTAVVCEGSEATAADKNSLHRFADQIGLTTAGLAEMGWKITTDELGKKREAQPARASSRSRLKAAPDATAGA